MELYESPRRFFLETNARFMKSIKLNAKENRILNANEMNVIGGGLQSPQLTVDYVWITQDGQDR